VAHDIRDTILDFIAHWSERTEIRALQLVDWIALSGSKFYSWRDRYGKVGEHNDLVPRDHWLEPWEKVAIISFHQEFPLEGYRRLTFMMLDRDVVAVSPSSTYRVLKARFLVHWELRAAMTELDVEIVLQRARERYPGTSPRIIIDNGPQFIAKDFNPTVLVVKAFVDAVIGVVAYFVSSNAIIKTANVGDFIHQLS
jgi:hypothetical protein